MLAATAAVGSGAPAALAESPLPDDNAGTGQYVEPVPDAGGDRPSAPGRDGVPRGSLPPATKRALPGGAEGRELESLATDPGSGAPATAEGARPSQEGEATRSPSSGDDESAISSIGSAVAGEDGASVPLLVLAIGLLTLGAAAVAFRRRRGGRPG